MKIGPESDGEGPFRWFLWSSGPDRVGSRATCNRTTIYLTIQHLQTGILTIQTNAGVRNSNRWVDGWTDLWYSGKTLSHIIRFRVETSQMSAVTSLIILIDDDKNPPSLRRRFNYGWIKCAHLRVNKHLRWDGEQLQLGSWKMAVHYVIPTISKLQ